MVKKKYELTDETMKFEGHTLHRIRAVKDFYASDGGRTSVLIEKGELGGWVESTRNLSQDDGCWIYDDAVVMDKAKLYEDAVIWGIATIMNNAKVHGKAWVHDESKVCDKAEVYGHAVISGYSKVYGKAKVYGDTEIDGYAEVDYEVSHGYIMKDDYGDYDDDF